MTSLFIRKFGSYRMQSVRGVAFWNSFAPVGSHVNENVKYRKKLKMENFEKRKKLKYDGYGAVYNIWAGSMQSFPSN